jgi:hypothetical protein
VQSSCTHLSDVHCQHLQKGGHLLHCIALHCFALKHLVNDLCVMQVLEQLCSVKVAHMWEFATDRNATHVARRLLCVLAGRDVMPAHSNARSLDGATYVRAAKVCAAVPPSYRSIVLGLQSPATPGLT